MKLYSLSLVHLLVCATLFLGGKSARATHIVGGETTYQCLGNGYYKITLTLFRDCGGVVMPDSSEIKVEDLNGNPVLSRWAAKGPSTFINVNNPGCGQPTPTVCIERADFVIDSAHLPGSAAGYAIFFQDCCRNYGIDNIDNAWNKGTTFPSLIFGNPSGCVSSPYFNAYPPAAVPANVPLQIDVSATDPDGDSLSYQLVAPLSDKPSQSYPFSAVPFAAGYSASNMVPSSPAFSLDATTGQITGTITQAGKFSVGIRVSKWRNNALVGRILRDYQFTVLQPWTVFASIASHTDAGCGGSGGSATAAAGGGSAPYSFLWSDNQTGQTATNLAPGQYSVIARGSGGCQDTAYVTIVGSAGFTVNVNSQTDATCANPKGSATLAVSGGTAPYTITWPDNGTGFSNTNLNPGANTVQITDATNCSGTATVQIGAAGAASLALDSLKNESCPGAQNGAIFISTSTGTAPFSFQWNDGAASQNRQNLSPGHYAVTVTDSAGCQDSLTFVITSGTGISAHFDSIINVECKNAGNGFLSVSANGTAPFSYQWSNGGAGAFQTNLPAGNYGVKITDANGCSDSVSAMVSEPDSLSISLKNKTDAHCGAADGSISIKITGGQKPYSIQWSGGQTDSAIVNLAAGNHSVVITDANGCTLSKGFSISPSSPLSLALDSVSAATCGRQNGWAAVSVSGGSAPFSFDWGSGPSGDTAGQLSAGAHSVKVTDGNGCTDSLSFQVPNQGGLSVVLDSSQNPSCPGSADGFAQLSILGGMPPYQVFWKNGDTSLSTHTLAAGGVFATVLDANGCRDSLFFSLQNPDSLKISLDSLASPGCAGNFSGFIAISVSGGSTPYQILWNTNDTVSVLNHLGAGSYTAVVSDARGCFSTFSTPLVPAPGVSLALDSLSGASCGASNGFARLSVSGGAPPFSIQWSNGAAGFSTDSLSPGAAFAKITDANSCTDSLSFLLPSADSLFAIFDSISHPHCAGDSSGFLSVSASGGTAPYSFLWTNNLTLPAQNNLAAGNYGVTVSDARGCSFFLSANLAAADSLEISLKNKTDASCHGANDGNISLQINGGQKPYSIQWSNGQSDSNSVHLYAGTHLVTITDANGCSVSDSFQINEPALLALQMDSAGGASCGISNGWAQLSVTGGRAPYSFSWAGGGSGDLATGMPGGNYQAWVTDSSGCTDSMMVQIASSPPISVIVDSLAAPLCAGQNSGFISVAAPAGASFAWSDGGAQNPRYQINSGPGHVWVTDGNGCADSLYFVIPAADSLKMVLDSAYHPACGGQNDGYLRVAAIGGAAPYSINWSNGASGNSIAFLPDGNYTATLSDANGCQVSRSFDLVSPSDFEVVVDSIVPPTCPGTATGRVYLRGKNGSIAQIISTKGKVGPGNHAVDELPAGKHIFIVQNQTGCEATVEVEITDPRKMKFALIEKRNPTCQNAHDGFLEVAVSGGRAPYFFLWENGDTLPARGQLASGDYSLTVFDADGCGADTSFSIGAAAGLRVEISTEETGCGTAEDQYVSLEFNGGKAPYQALLNDKRIDVTDHPAASGHYDLRVEDAQGCTFDTVVFIEKKTGGQLFIADAFSPNGDGLNDKFEMAGHPECHGGGHFEIFNRWGTRVFVTDRPLEEFWDGTFGGQPVKADVYTYYFSVGGEVRHGVFTIVK